MSSPTPPVHPRVCGELRKGKAPRKGETGSSPRVRGTPAGVEPAGRPRRFIPACAGNSRAARSRQPRKTVHPRVCGELGQQWPEFHADDGSSPRVRGTRISSSISIVCGTVHPRVCGELALADAAAEIDAGSSPRVRGTLPRHRRRRRARRFIPACAGNSSIVASAAMANPVHPRVCGELGTRMEPKRSPCGSSPRVRGTPKVRQRANRALTGSSPRVRGTPGRGHGQSTRLRFIPACAGNSP